MALVTPPLHQCLKGMRTYHQIRYSEAVVVWNVCEDVLVLLFGALGGSW